MKNGPISKTAIIKSGRRKAGVRLEGGFPGIKQTINIRFIQKGD
jgi:hypothetical protein